MSRTGFTPGDPRAREAAIRGGRASGEARRWARVCRWALLFPGLDPSLVDRIYLLGYNARATSKPHSQRKAATS